MGFCWFVTHVGMLLDSGLSPKETFFGCANDDSGHQQYNAFDLLGGRVSIPGCLCGRGMMEAPDTPELELPELSQENFERLTPEACRVFVFRAAVRVMPLIGDGKNGLAFWPDDDRRRYLAVVVAGVDVLLLALNNRAIHALSIASTAVYAAAAATKVSIAVSSEVAVIAMQWDLHQLLLQNDALNKSEKVISTPLALLSEPLWRKGALPEGWTEVVLHWRVMMAAYNMNDVVPRYMDLVDGKPWDIDETERRFNAWYERYQEEEKPENQGELKSGPVTLSGSGNVRSKLNLSEVGGNPSPSEDGPTTDDALGREALVKALAAFLDYETYKGQTTIFRGRQGSSSHLTK